MFRVPNEYRIETGPMGSNCTIGNNGAFDLRTKEGVRLYAIASDGMGWEHVSVSCHNRCPDWDEMCFVKNLFWDEDDCVIQFHPPKSEYVNNHKYCLHLWRPTSQSIPLPDSTLVGIKAHG